MKAKIKRNWWGEPELIYECPKCRCTLTSSRKEVEAGKDVCPECRNVFHIPPSLFRKFDAAEHQHQETLAVEKEDERQKTRGRKQKSIEEFISLVKKYPYACLIALCIGFLCLIAMDKKTERDRNERVPTVRREAKPKSFWDSEKFRNSPEKVKEDMVIFKVLKNAGYSDAEAAAAVIQTMDQ